MHKFDDLIPGPREPHLYASGIGIGIAISPSFGAGGIVAGGGGGGTFFLVTDTASPLVDDLGNNMIWG